MQRTRVKICGITRPEDAIAAASEGADAIGLIFYTGSPRHVTPASANEIIRELPPFVVRVGLFVDALEEYIRSVISTVRLDLLQFHGSETPADCRRFSMPYIKAVRMKPDVDLPEMCRQFGDAQGLLLDTWLPAKAGGTGETFDWSRVPSGLKKPVILAGGLNAGNVMQAVRLIKPYAVDVSGGVESSPGIKDRNKIRAFIEQIRECNHEQQATSD